jgi:hypothetical protein
MLSCLSSRNRRAISAEQSEDLTGQVALQAPDDFELREAISGPSCPGGLGALVGADADEDGQMQGAVGCTVAATVQPMALGLA